MARTRNEALHQKRREEILAAAADRFATKGVHQTTMQEICDASGVSAGTLYRYFESKDAIIVAFAEQERDETRLLINRVQSAESVAAGLSEILPALLAETFNQQNGRLTLEIGAEAARNENVGMAFRHIDAEVCQALINAISKDQSRGVIPAHVDAEAVVFLLLALIDGISGRAAFLNQNPGMRLLEPLRAVLEALLTVGSKHTATAHAPKSG